jgi:formylglycine-generating enzyme required for sulfatase activity
MAAKGPKEALGALIEGYDDGSPTIAPVGQFTPTPLGLYDLEGNVSEWCEDWMDRAKAQRVVRGGSWQDGQRHLALSFRNQFPPAFIGFSTGFRVVLAQAVK